MYWVDSYHIQELENGFVQQVLYTSASMLFENLYSYLLQLSKLCLFEHISFRYLKIIIAGDVADYSFLVQILERLFS